MKTTKRSRVRSPDWANLGKIIDVIGHKRNCYLRANEQDGMGENRMEHNGTGWKGREQDGTQWNGMEWDRMG